MEWWTAAICVAALLLLIRRERRGLPSAHPIVAVFPAALLFLVLPTVLPVLLLMQAFVSFGQTGTGLDTVASLSEEVARTSRLGALGFLGVIVVAGALRPLASRGHRSDTTMQGSPTPTAGWRRALVWAVPLLALPIWIVSYAASEVPRSIVRIATSTGPSPGETVESVSQKIAGLSVLSAFGGLMIAAILGALACSNLFVVRAVSNDSDAARVEWAAVVALSLWAIWSVVQLTTDLRAYPLPQQ